MFENRLSLCDISLYIGVCVCINIITQLFISVWLSQSGKEDQWGFVKPIQRLMGMNDYCSALYLLLTVSWCHHPETHNTRAAQLVVVSYIPTKTTVVWLITHWHYIGLVKWIVQGGQTFWCCLHSLLISVTLWYEWLVFDMQKYQSTYLQW